MQRFVTTSLMIVLFGLVVLWAGCSRGGAGRAPTPPIPDTPDEATKIAAPEWFLNPPKDPNYLYATGTAKSKGLQLAMDAAINAGRTEIARQVQVKISALFKRFTEEVGVGEDSELIAETAAISKAVAVELLSLSVPIKRHYERETTVHYRTYVLVEMPIGLAKATLAAKIKENKNMYTRFRASQAFKELEEEVEEYEQLKKEQGQ